MTMTADTTALPAPTRQPLLRIALAVLAAIETLSAMTDLSALFFDYGHTDPLLVFAQAVTKAKIAVAPLFAIAAFVFAVSGRVRAAIAVLAALILLAWLSDLPSIAIHGLELSGGIAGMHALALRVIYPLVAIAAIVLARRNAHLGVAAVLVSLPTVIAWVGVIAFGIAVMIYGF